jgi:hypothetical protein
MGVMPVSASPLNSGISQWQEFCDRIIALLREIRVPELKAVVQHWLERARRAQDHTGGFYRINCEFFPSIITRF